MCSTSEIVEAVNASGDAYLTHTTLRGQRAMRIGVGQRAHDRATSGARVATDPRRGRAPVPRARSGCRGRRLTRPQRSRYRHRCSSRCRCSRDSSCSTSCRSHIVTGADPARTLRRRGRCGDRDRAGTHRWAMSDIRAARARPLFPCTARRTLAHEGPYTLTRNPMYRRIHRALSRHYLRGQRILAADISA